MAALMSKHIGKLFAKEMYFLTLLKPKSETEHAQCAASLAVASNSLFTNVSGYLLVHLNEIQFYQ